jgi:hypothetical protein
MIKNALLAIVLLASSTALTAADVKDPKPLVLLC